MTMSINDLSNNNGSKNIADYPADGYMFKATEGTYFVDQFCDAFVQQCIKAGKPFGVYHFMSNEDPTTQANVFYQNIKGYVGKGILCLDFEADGLQLGSTGAKTFLDRLYALTGVKPLIYMSASVTKQFNWSAVVAADYGLWVADYDELDPLGYWSGPAMWQYTSSPYDKNTFYGDSKTWNAYAGNKGGKPSVPSKPAPQDPTRAGASYSILQDPNYPQNKAHLDRFGPVGDKLLIEGWHTTVSKHEFIIIKDRVTNKELARKEVTPVHRPDVKKAFGLSYDEVGFNTTIDLAPLRGHSVIALMRATNDPEGNTKGGFQDFTETRWYHDIH